MVIEEAELNLAMLKFNQSLIEWLDEGGDERLRAFTPLEDWAAVTRLMVAFGKREAA